MHLGRTRRIVIAISLGIAFSIITYRTYQMTRPEPPAFHTGILRVAVDPSLPPFAYFNADSEVVGLDIDLAHALGEQLGLDVNIQVYGLDGLYDALANDNVDVIISAIHPEAWRMGDVRYTRAYFDVGLVLVTYSESEIHTMSDLSGHTLAYTFGSVADTEARAWGRRIAPFEQHPFELPAYALDAVRLNQASAALVDAVSARLYLRDHQDWDATYTHVTNQPLAIAVRIDQTGTFRKISAGLNELIASGLLDIIISRWL